MKKKYLALVLCICVMILSLSLCCAADDDSYKSNTGVIDLSALTVSGDGVSVSGSKIEITKGGDFEVTGTLSNGSIYVNAEGEKVKLRLSGMSLTNESGSAIYFDNCEKAFITITENTTNTLSDGEYSGEDENAVLFSKSNLEIKGNGTLNINANCKHAISSKDNISVENGTLVLNSNGDGLHANDKITISGGKIDITSNDDGIQSEDLLIIDSGEITIHSKDKGITSDGDLTINGGTIKISEATEGIESKKVMTVNGGDIDITCSDDGLNTGGGNTAPGEFNPSGQRPFDKNMQQSDKNMPDQTQMMGNPQFGNENPPKPPDGEQKPDKMPKDESMPDGQNQKFEQKPESNSDNSSESEKHDLYINGGTIVINAGGDGIDSNGTLVINGGTLFVNGSSGNGDSPLDSEDGITINGGKVFAVGSSGMLETPVSDSKQNTLCTALDKTYDAGETVSIVDRNKNVIAKYTVPKSFGAVIYSSENLKTGEKYTINVGQNSVQTITQSDTVTSNNINKNFPGQRGGMGMFRQEKPEN